MAKWRATVKITHLLTDKADHASVQKSMSAIADTLMGSAWFGGFSVAKFRHIPAGDEVIGAQEYANRLLTRMYDYADEHRIWLS